MEFGLNKALELRLGAVNTYLERQPLHRRDEPSEGRQWERYRSGTLSDVPVSSSACCTPAQLAELEEQSDT